VFRLTLPRRPGTELVRSPLHLERPFDRALADAAVSSTPTGEIRIGPDLLPDLEAPGGEDAPDEGTAADGGAAADGASEGESR
jgi:two-component system sensor histidine kinase MtrB